MENPDDDNLVFIVVNCLQPASLVQLQLDSRLPRKAEHNLLAAVRAPGWHGLDRAVPQALVRFVRPSCAVGGRRGVGREKPAESAASEPR
jgi:hypothetical protein